jgi:hypothetical protein
MLRTSLIVLALIASGCDPNSRKLFDVLTGHDSTVVVLAARPMVITAQTATLTSSEVMKVIGEWTSVCLALRGGLPLQHSTVMDHEFDAAMHGARVRVVLELTNGDRVSLAQPMMAWNMDGKIVKSNELSACASPCDTKLPVGTQVSKIDVSSDSPLAVQGVYWSSERGPLEKTPAPANGGAATPHP